METKTLLILDHSTGDTVPLIITGTVWLSSVRDAEGELELMDPAADLETAKALVAGEVQDYFGREIQYKELANGDVSGFYWDGPHAHGTIEIRSMRVVKLA